ncbi:MAG: glycosyltransferase [Pseudomonadota bacterium]
MVNLEQVGERKLETRDTTKPLVAVVTPCYNGAPYIERTLASVQAQTYPNIVHCVLDNASTDESPELIKAAMNGPVRIITKRNNELLQQVPNWNAAIAMTPPDAKYVKFLAADDLMRDDCIEKMVALAESDPEIDFVHAIDVFNSESKPHGLDPNQSVYKGSDYARRYLSGIVTWLSATHVFFRVTPERLKEPFNPAIRPFMDNDFILRELLDRKMGFVFEPLLFTRYDEGTVTASLGGMRSYMIASFELLLRHGAKLFDEAELSQLIRRERYKILRHLFYWQMSGDKKNALGASEGLKKHGMAANPIDTLIAVLSWPFYKMELKRIRNSEVTTSISECTFFPKAAIEHPTSSI